MQTIRKADKRRCEDQDLGGRWTKLPSKKRWGGGLYLIHNLIPGVELYAGAHVQKQLPGMLGVWLLIMLFGRWKNLILSVIGKCICVC